MESSYSVVPFNKLPDPRKGKGINDILRDILSVEEVCNQVLPFFDGGDSHAASINGHKVMDLSDACNVILKYDEKHGDKLAPYNLKKKVLGDKLKNVLRERYTLNDKWKIEGPNPKVAALLSARAE